MGKSGNGPDWPSIAMYMWELEKALGCDILMVVTPGTSVGGLPLSTTVLAARKDRAPWALGEACSVEVDWPHRENRTYEGAVFKALVELDARVRREDFLTIVLPA